MFKFTQTNSPDKCVSSQQLADKVNVMKEETMPKSSLHHEFVCFCLILTVLFSVKVTN